MARGANRAERRRVATPGSDILAAIAHHRAGRLDKAEAIYQALLQKDPRNAGCLNLLGAIALDRGRPTRAIQLIASAIAIAPNFASAHVNLGNAQRAAGNLADACGSYRRAIAMQPDLADAHANLCLALCERGEFTDAATCGERAVQVAPQLPDAYANLGIALRALGKLEAAEHAARRAVALAPERANLNANLGNILLDRQHPDEAAQCYRLALERAPRLASAHYGLGNCLSLSGDVEAAVASYRTAVALDAGQAAPWNDLGRALRSLGHFDDAAGAFQHALAINPNFADAYRNLATCRRIAADDGEIARLSALANKGDVASEERVIAGFALGKLLDDADRFDEAFVAYHRANAEYRVLRATTGERFDPNALRHEVDETIEAYTPSRFERMEGWGNSSEVPVFIVGMPRSGTSLVEQIAASHSRVVGAGELKDIGRLAAELGADQERWEHGTVRRLADEQLERLRHRAPGADRVIDKLPDNIFMLGVIAALFPSARIVFCHRDPRDIALSCFFQKFSPGQLVFSYDLSDCGRRYRETARLMAHWRRVLPLPMIDIGYEALVADLEGQSRRLLAFLALPWEPACLDFHKTERPVTTASGWQVRQPLYGRSVGRWRHYERHLGPLIAELEPIEDSAIGIVS
jgi:tetratricopeptide (TPR) repeat protein